MIANLRSTWYSVKASYWFFPAIFAVVAFVLSLVLVRIDRLGMADYLSGISALHPARPESASNMLTVLAGSTIGVASTVFSITIAAVAYASGNYGPRLLNNFMEDKGNQLSLATFVGTFVYALSVLRTVRAEDESPTTLTDATSQSLPGFVPQLSLLVAYGLMIVSVGVLVYFLHHIPSSIRINSVLEDIGKRLLGQIEIAFPDADAGPEIVQPSPSGCTVPAIATGYVRTVEFGQLLDVARKHDCRIGMALRVGDFVHPGVALVRLNCADDDKKIAEAVRDCFALGASPTPEQDLEFSIDELVEIALRALSPGINDPFTAITAIHWLGAATALLGRRDLRKRIDDEDPGTCAVIPLDDGFAHYLSRGFGAMRSAIASNRLAALVTYHTLAQATGVIDEPERRARLRGEGALLLAQAERALEGPDLDEVRERYREFDASFVG